MSTQPVTLPQELAEWRTTHGSKDFKEVQKKWAKGPVGVQKTKDWLKSAKAGIDADSATRVHANRDRIVALSNQINPATLTDAQREQLTSASVRANQAVAAFDASWPAYQQAVRDTASTIARTNTLRILGQIVGIVIGIICVPSPAWWFGILLIVGVIIAGSILKGRLTQQAWELSSVANRPARIANGILGGPARGRLETSGIYAEVDRIWVNGLGAAARDAELSQRAAVKAEAQQNLRTPESTGGDYAWLNDPRITHELNEIMINIGGRQSDSLDRSVVLNAVKRELPSYATVEQALPVLRDIVERQWNKYGADGQTPGTVRASERVLYDDEQ